MEKLILILLLIGFIRGDPVKNNKIITDTGSCALKACHEVDPNKINVHLIAHSHDDVGWLKTFEEYFWGLNRNTHNVGVEYIFDSVLQALQENSDRRFIQVETAYFWKWWNKQTQEKQDLFKNFVESGIIEMVGGGWAMNDEACVSYQSTINQFSWGLRLLNDTLGECGRPRIGWQIDPFGHSREQASIFKQMGYDAIFFWRLSEDDRKQRKSTKDVEFMWKTNDNFEDSEIFTSIMDGYFAPSSFCWDYLQCSSDAINDDPESFDYNLDERIAKFSEHIANYSSYFRTNNILYTMGGDFQYQAPQINYLNIDKLIKGFKDLNSSYNVFYSTPSCYIQAVKAANVQFSVKKSGDFFPYNENAHAYWSGYFSSRSTLKRYERMGHSILQAAQQLNAFAKIIKYNNGTDSEENVRNLREAVGTMQHHDAITGTEKEKVAYDYSRILTKAIRDAENNIGRIVGNILKKENVTEDVNLRLSTCLLTNISVCDNTLKKKSLIVIFNPLPKYAPYHIRLPVQDATYKLTGVYGDVYFELVKHMNYPVKYPFNTSDAELMFSDSIPPMGIKVYYLQKVSDVSTAIKPKLLKNNEIITIQKNKTKITYDPQTRKYSFTSNDATNQIVQKYMYYVSNNGTGSVPGSGDNITSGAYIFRPVNGSAATKIINNERKIMHLKGKLHDEIIEKIGDYIVQTTRLFVDDGLEHIEFDWVVGPLDNKTVDTVNNYGKEIIVRFSVHDVTTKTFYTDSNGRQLIERFRNNYPYNDSTVEPVASNYYPVTTRISIKNDSQDFFLSILTDRAQGGSSLNDGEIELLIHRRTLLDDHKGLDESLQEMEYDNYIVTRGQHFLVVDSPSTAKILAVNKLTQPWMLIADATSSDMTYEKLSQTIEFKWLGLTVNQGQGLPPNLNVLNFEPWKDDTYLFRLEHIFEKNEDENYSKEVSLELKYIFYPYVMSSIKEVSLGANVWIEGTITGDNYNVTFSPMEIRTFIITFKDPTKNS